MAVSRSQVATASGRTSALFSAPAPPARLGAGTSVHSARPGALRINCSTGDLLTMSTVIVRLCDVDRHSQWAMMSVIATRDSRDQMIRAAIELLSERGYAGTSFGDVIERSGAPRGSIYHHFPGGKQQLVTEAVQRYTAAILRALDAAAESGTAVDLVRVFVDVVRT